MNRFLLLIIIPFLLTLGSCTKDQMSSETELDNELRQKIRSASETGKLDYYILPNEDDLANIPQDPKNPLTHEKVQLGKFLYFETAFAADAMFESGMGTYSCSSCHIAEAGFMPGRAQGIADGGLGFGANGENRVRNTEYKESEMDVQSARPLSMVNVAYVTNTFWNGQFGSTAANVGTEDIWDLREDTERNHLGFEGIETQNFEGVVSHRINYNEQLVNDNGYRPLFDAAFPDVAEDERYGIFTGSLALSAYIRTILSNQAPFQEWLKGKDDAMTATEKRGASIFFGEAKCTNCHYRPNLGSLEFHALGVNDMYQIPSFNAFESDRRNLGRGGFTQKIEDNYKFKVPQLYNLVDAPFFFHGASKLTIEDLVDYKIAAQSENFNVDQSLISDKFLALNLTAEEREQLIAFLSNALRDPNLPRYKPDFVLSGQCFPNNDPLSARDLLCN